MKKYLPYLFGLFLLFTGVEVWAQGYPAPHKFNTIDYPYDNTGIDAFGRSKVSNPKRLFESKHISDKLENLWMYIQEGTTEGVIFNYKTASVDLVVPANTTARITKATHRTWSYQSGMSQHVMFTAVMARKQDGLTQTFLYGNEENGIYFSQQGDDYYWGLRSNVSGTVVDTTVGLNDTTNPWHVDTDNAESALANSLKESLQDNPGMLARGIIVWFDMQWLGTGRVRCGFEINGKTVVMHEFHNSFFTPNAFMQSGSQQCRYIIENDGTAKKATFRTLCTSVVSEGGQELFSSGNSISTGYIAGIGTNETSVLAIRAVTHHINGATNFRDIFLNDINTYSDSQTLTVKVYHVQSPADVQGLFQKANSRSSIMYATSGGAAGLNISNGTATLIFEHDVPAALVGVSQLPGSNSAGRGKLDPFNIISLDATGQSEFFLLFNVFAKTSTTDVKVNVTLGETE